MEILLPRLEEWQQEVYDDVIGNYKNGQTFVIKSGRQRGKSFLLNIILLDYSLRWSGVSMVVEPTINQSRRLFKQMSRAIEGMKFVKHINNSLLSIEFENGSEIHYKSAEQKEGLRGFTVSNLLCIDEAQFIPDSIIEILIPTTTVNKANIVMASTPMFAQGFYYEQYMLGLDEAQSKIRSYDWSLGNFNMEKYLPLDTREYYKKIYTPQKYQCEIEGEFIKDRSYIFGDYGDCIIKSKFIEDKEPVFVGIDWGTGNGGDSTVLTAINGIGQVVEIWDTNSMEPNAQVVHIANWINAHPSIEVVIVERNSIGSVFMSDLNSQIENKSILSGFNTSNDSKREIIENLIRSIGLREIGIPENAELMKQMSHYAIQRLSKGYTYNAPAGFHDDYIISLALAWKAFKDGGFLPWSV